MSTWLQVVIPALQVPLDGKSARDLQAEVVKEQTLRSELAQSSEQPVAESSETESSSDPKNNNNVI